MRGTFRITSSTMNWRSIPWPFGLIEIRESSLFLYSKHWSWWAPDRQIPKEGDPDSQRPERVRNTEGTN